MFIIIICLLLCLLNIIVYFILWLMIIIVYFILNYYLIIFIDVSCKDDHYFNFIRNLK